MKFWRKNINQKIEGERLQNINKESKNEFFVKRPYNYSQYLKKIGVIRDRKQKAAKKTHNIKQFVKTLKFHTLFLRIMWDEAIEKPDIGFQGYLCPW